MNILDQLGRDEGCILYAYQDNTPEKYWTIGIGRLIDKRRGGGISLEEAHYLLRNDVAKAQANCTAHFPFFKNLDDARQGVLINLCFNMGISKLEQFPRFLGAMERGDWETATTELLASRYAIQVGDRAKRLAMQLTTGEWV